MLWSEYFLVSCFFSKYSEATHAPKHIEIAHSAAKRRVWMCAAPEIRMAPNLRCYWRLLGATRDFGLG